MDFSGKKLIVIVGPTAVGKTTVAITLARHFQTEIISADSRQIFRELSIGTAKPNQEELATVRHHFIDSHSIHVDYNAARYGDEALALIYKLFESYNYLVVCGGSGLYIKALLEGFDAIPEIPAEIREHLVDQHKLHGLAWLQQKMLELDAELYGDIDNQNPVRLMRAVEVKLATGQSIANFHKQGKKKLPFTVVKIGLELPREELYGRIDKRMDEMIERGLFNEATGLQALQNNYALQTVGYQEIFGYLRGEYDREEAIRLLKRNSRRYAKRQLTWFKGDKKIKWFQPLELNTIIAHVSHFRDNPSQLLC